MDDLSPVEILSLIMMPDDPDLNPKIFLHGGQRVLHDNAECLDKSLQLRKWSTLWRNSMVLSYFLNRRGTATVALDTRPTNAA